MTTERIVAALLLLAAYALLCLLVYGRQRRRLKRAAEEAAAMQQSSDGAAPLLVLYASQTGQAEEIALQTAKALQTAGVPLRLAVLGTVDRAELRATTRALFITATYGEGDPPDSAAAFVDKVMGAPDGADLAGLHIGVLALGDSSYRHYCGFGRALDGWLQRQGAQPLFARIDVDKADPQALTQWQRQLSHLAGTLDLPDWEAPRFDPWQLSARQHLNPGSQGEPVFHLELAPSAGAELPAWEAGDLVQVCAPADPDRPREYSIASIPADGRIHLLVRQAMRSDGSPGLASGWLTAGAGLGEPIALRLRAHSGFRLGGNAARPLILIGNGTGLAGLRAHLKARAASAAPVAGAWLVFGERQSACDTHYRTDIDGWLATGVLHRVDWAFSRDQQQRRYVQHVLSEQAERVRDWVAQGAAIYVCGSLEGMAGAVDTALREALGTDALLGLMGQGRYRRDVY